MEHDITTQVLRVRSEPSRDGQSIKHLVSLSGGVAADGTQYPPDDYVTFDPELMGKAGGLQGQMVDARVELKQVPKARGGGFWLNKNISDIAPQGMLTPMAVPAPGGTPAQVAPQAPVVAPAVQQAPVATPHPHPALAGQEEQKSEERRRSAFHAAAEFIGSAMKSGLIADYRSAADSFTQLTDDLVNYAATGTWAQTKHGEANVDPQKIAAAANQEIPGAVQVGVPFDTQPAA